MKYIKMICQCTLIIISLLSCKKSVLTWSSPEEIENIGTATMPILNSHSLTIDNGMKLLDGSETAEKSIGDPGYSSSVNLITFKKDGSFDLDNQLSQANTLARGTFIVTDASGESYAFWGERRVPMPTFKAPEDALMSDLIFSQSTDGKQWSAGQSIFHISSDSPTNLMWVPVSGTIDNEGTVHIVVMTGVPYYIHYANHMSGGNWTPFRTLFQGLLPDLTSDKNGNLYMTFLGNDTTQNVPNSNSVFFSKSTDGGKTWGTPTLIHLSPEQNGGQHPHIWVTNGGQIHIMWQSYTNSQQQLLPDQIWQTWSDDGGASWTQPSQVPDLPTGQLIYRMSGTKLPNDQYYIAYTMWDYPSNPSDRTLYVRYWDENSGQWSNPKIINQGEHVRGEESLAYDPSTKHLDVVWDQYDNNATPPTFQLYSSYKNLSGITMPPSGLVSGMTTLLH